MTVGYGYVKSWRHNKKRRIVAAFGGCCAICGVVDVPNVYDVHHLDPAKKNFRFSRSIIAWAKLREQAADCVLLCANCHRKVHAGVSSVPESAQRFDESLIPSDILYKPELTPCPVCGRPKRPRRMTCSNECRIIRSRQYERPPYEEISRLVAETSFEAAARKYGVSSNTIRKWLNGPRGLNPAGLGAVF